MPPPLTGNSLPVKVLHDALRPDHDIQVINVNKKNHVAGVDSFARIFEVVSIIRQVWSRQKKSEVVYLTVAESLAGNLRDVIIYLICFSRLDTVVIHMLGGAGMRNILAKKNSLRRLANEFFMRRLGAIIVEGWTQREMFAAVASPDRIHIVPNFAQDELFLSDDLVAAKFQDTDPLRILFLSNMLYGKGHFELLDAYLRCASTFKEHVVVDFAGELVSAGDRRKFLTMIEGVQGIRYHGSVSGTQRRELYANAHIFCLPTYYPYEGQPFCILEAYATGCVVVTTNHSGIRNVFAEPANGFEVEKQSVDSLVSILKELVAQRGTLGSIALNNLRLARQCYTQSTYLASMTRVLETLTGSRCAASDSRGID